MLAHPCDERVRALELRVHRHDDGLCLLEHIADIRLNDQPKATKTGKKPAAAPFASKAGKTQKNPLFESRPKNFDIGEFYLSYLMRAWSSTGFWTFTGQVIQSVKDLTRFVVK